MASAVYAVSDAHEEILNKFSPYSSRDEINGAPLLEPHGWHDEPLLCIGLRTENVHRSYQDRRKGPDPRALLRIKFYSFPLLATLKVTVAHPDYHLKDLGISQDWYVVCQVCHGAERQAVHETIMCVQNGDGRMLKGARSPEQLDNFAN